jgi:putative peptide zinc metalloprotease protein
VPLTLNPNLLVHPLDAASDREMVLCEVPAQKDSLLRFALPAELYELLGLFDGRRQVSEVVEAFDGSHPGRFSRENIEGLVSKFFLPKGLLVDPESPQTLPEQSARRPRYVYAKMRLIPASVVIPVARLCRWPFQKWVVAAWVPSFVAMHALFYFVVLHSHRININDLTGERFMLVGLLGLLAAFVHEMGHASALASYGCKQTEIGVGLYIYFPVLYTDVSEAWKLTRWQRAMIDIAGVYFQSSFMLLMLCLFYLTGSNIFLFAFLFMDLTIANTLNPFLRMDGYWLVADLFGIFNLREQSMNLLGRYVGRLFGARGASRAKPPALSRGGKVALAVYTSLCTLFFLYIFTIMFRQSVFYLLPNYPRRILALWQVMRESPFSPLKAVSMTLEFVWRSVVLFGLSFFFYRLVRGLLRYSIRLVRLRRGRRFVSLSLGTGLADNANRPR